MPYIKIIKFQSLDNFILSATQVPPFPLYFHRYKNANDVRFKNLWMLVNAGAAGQLALLSRTWLFVHLIEWLFAWSPSKNGLDWQRRMQISARCGSPEISLVWLSLTRWAWWIWVIYWSCRRASRRSAQRFLSVSGSNFGHQSPPSLSSIKVYLVPKLSASSRFAYTFIRFNLFNLEAS